MDVAVPAYVGLQIILLENLTIIYNYPEMREFTSAEVDSFMAKAGMIFPFLGSFWEMAQMPCREDFADGIFLMQSLKLADEMVAASVNHPSLGCHAGANPAAT